MKAVILVAGVSKRLLPFVDVSDMPCIEIDFTEDLEEAQRLTSADQGSSCDGEIS
ncbi:hypothetical protein ES703_36983 [subsurface metagenome]